jgi:hypothetical protein
VLDRRQRSPVVAHQYQIQSHHAKNTKRSDNTTTIVATTANLGSVGIGDQVDPRLLRQHATKFVGQLVADALQRRRIDLHRRQRRLCLLQRFDVARRALIEITLSTSSFELQKMKSQILQHTHTT